MLFNAQFSALRACGLRMLEVKTLNKMAPVCSGAPRRALYHVLCAIGASKRIFFAAFFPKYERFVAQRP